MGLPIIYRTPLLLLQIGNYEGIVEIPSLIIVDGREYRVTSIQFNAFYKSKATEIILPEELEYIGRALFKIVKHWKGLSSRNPYDI